MEISVEVMPQTVADKKKNGYGREAPNMFPCLPEPVGRFKFVGFTFLLIGSV